MNRQARGPGRNLHVPLLRLSGCIDALGHQPAVGLIADPLKDAAHAWQQGRRRTAATTAGHLKGLELEGRGPSVEHQDSPPTGVELRKG